mgnify:CR=1 FL=1
MITIDKDYTHHIHILGDATENNLKLHVKIKTWVFDPPYNINYNYSKLVDDNLPQIEYYDYLRKCSKNMINNSCESANMFHINTPENCTRTLNIFEETGWKLKQIISWVYSSNKGMSNSKCTNAHRSIFWFVKGEPETYMDAKIQPYKNPNHPRVEKYIQEGKRGTHLYSWWNIQLRKGNSKDHSGWYNSLPSELVENIILLTTKKSEIVGDLNAGGCTTYSNAKRLLRNSVSIDIDPKSKEIFDKLRSQTTLLKEMIL